MKLQRTKACCRSFVDSDACDCMAYCCLVLVAMTVLSAIAAGFALLFYFCADTGVGGAVPLGILASLGTIPTALLAGAIICIIVSGICYTVDVCYKSTKKAVKTAVDVEMQ